MTLAKQRADALAAQLKTAPNFQAAAKAAGLEAVTTNPIARDGVIPNIGRSPEIEAVAFSSPVGTVSNAIATPQGAAIVKVASRQDVSPADFAMAKDKFRMEMLGERRSRFYQTYMEKARDEDEDRHRSRSAQARHRVSRSLTTETRRRRETQRILCVSVTLR